MQNHNEAIFGRKGQGKTTLAKQKVAKLSRLFIVDNLAEYTEGTIFETYGALRYYFRTARPQFRCIIRVSTEEEMEQALELVWTVGHCTLLAEEVNMYCPLHGGSPAFHRLVVYGRHQAVNIIGVSRAPAEVSKIFTSQCDEIHSFNQQEDSHLEYMERRGFNREELQHLQAREYLTHTY